MWKIELFIIYIYIIYYGVLKIINNENIYLGFIMIISSIIILFIIKYINTPK